MIIEYNEKYLSDVKNLLVELEEYILEIDEDHLDTLHEDYKDLMATIDLEKVFANSGACYLYVSNEDVLGLIMGFVRKYDEYDYLDYKCPRSGVVSELVVSKKCRGQGIGEQLMKKMEDYFKSIGCEYVFLEVFAYNKRGINFYNKLGYHPRGITDVKKL